MIIPLHRWGWTCWVLLYSPRYICCCFRGRSRVRCWRRWVEVVSAPNFACGVGPLQDISASAILWARAGSNLGRALVYYRSCFTAYHRLYRVSASTEVVRWLNYLLNKYVISLLGLIFISHLVSADMGTLQLVVSRVTLWLLLKKVVPITCLYRHVWFFFDLISTKLLICFSTKWNGERKEQGGSDTQRGREVVAQGPRWLWYNFWTGFSVSLSSMLLNFLGPSSLCIEFCYVYLHLNQASLLAVFYLSYIMFAGVISLMDICTMFMPFELDSLWLNSLCYNYGQI